MTYTKKIALHDRITVDGVDMSNAFHSFGFTSEAATVDASGFSVSGVDETLSGAKAQGFQGDVYVTKEVETILWPIHLNNTSVGVSWQPDGLIDSSRTSYHGLCQLRTFSPADTRGDASTFTAVFTIADSNGITTT